MVEERRWQGGVFLIFSWRYRMWNISVTGLNVGSSFTGRGWRCTVWDRDRQSHCRTWESRRRVILKKRSLCVLISVFFPIPRLGKSNICPITTIAYNKVWLCRFLAKIIVTEGSKDIAVNAPIAIMVSTMTLFLITIWQQVVQSLTYYH